MERHEETLEREEENVVFWRVRKQQKLFSLISLCAIFKHRRPRLTIFSGCQLISSPAKKMQTRLTVYSVRSAS